MNLRARGVTLLELVLASTLLLLLTATLFSIFASGSRGWLTASRNSDRFGELLKVARLLEPQLGETSAASLELSVSPGAVCFASAFGLRTSAQATVFTTVPVTGATAWQKYVIYYHDPVGKRLFWREIAIPAGNAAESTATPISAFDSGSGVHPLSFYLTGGQRVAEHLDVFAPSLSSQTLSVRLESIGPEVAAGYGKLQYVSATFLRN